MKVLLVSEFYWPNLDGAALFEHRLAHGLKQRGQEVLVWAPAAGWRSGVEDDEGVTTFRQGSFPLIGKPGYRMSSFPFVRAFTIMRRERPDIVHIHNCTQIGVAALLAARWYHLPVVTTNHAMPENVLGRGWPNWIRRPLTKLLWWMIVSFHNQANSVTAPSPIALAYLQRHGLKRPAKAITNGLDLNYFCPPKGAAKSSRPHAGAASTQTARATGAVKVLYIGRLDYEKNLPVLVRAMAIAQAGRPKRRLQLTIVGGGNQEKSLLRLVKKLRLDGAVKLSGKVSEAQKLQLLQQTDLFVMPSPAELQSIATMEALACAKPVIAADAGALPNLIENGVNGYLFDHTNPSELAEKLLTLADSAALRRRLGRAGLALMRRDHRSESCYQRYEELFRQLTGLQMVSAGA